MASDAKFFARGKIQEFRKELEEAESTKDKKFIKRKTVLKKIVANITMGNDMSALFPDIIRCMPIQVLEIKKMVYLFLVSYGRSKPDSISIAMPSLLTDCNDRNPLIRALAIRTMSYIPLPIVLSGLREPLRHCLKDADPYVRKTAAICVAKLWIHDARIVEKESFITQLRDLLADPNPTVVANAVAALTEISERSDEITLKLNITVASKLLTALAEASEWGQVYILDSLMYFVPQTHDEAELLAERISVRLQHANSAVVLTSIKVILYLMNYMGNSELKDSLCRKMGPPLVTLLSAGPEVQYVALRNILLVIQRRPAILRDSVKVFFCKYNDPVYNKLAKLEIMYRLSHAENAKIILAELQEYATEVDIDFVRKSVRTIGRLAIKVPAAADLCIQTLLQLLETKISYVIQEVVVVIRDIFRRYPNKYESIIPTLCENMNELTDPEPKAAIIWIIGQYADRIENATELLDELAFSFLEEQTEVQLALLTAVVKLFIQKPDASKELVSKVLRITTEEIDNPDLRDRGFIYWRLLSTNATAAKVIVLSDKPPISTETDRMDRGTLDQLLLHTGTLGSIYHKNPETFIRSAKGKQLPDSPALNSASRAVLIRLPDESDLGPRRMPEYRPTPGGPSDFAAVHQGLLIGPDNTTGVAGDDMDPPEQEESLLGSRDAGDEAANTDHEFTPSPMATTPNFASESPNVPVQAAYDPYANLDGLFRTPQPLNVPATNGRRGPQDDLLL